MVEADVLIMAAAVADFRPRNPQGQKIKKQADEDQLTLHLVKNPDIIAGIDKASLVKIGFAAETQDLLENAKDKLASKGLAMIVANDAIMTIGSDCVQATLLFADGREMVRLDAMQKDDAARRILKEVPTLLEAAAP